MPLAVQNGPATIKSQISAILYDFIYDFMSLT